jgi:hypothetical protein
MLTTDQISDLERGIDAATETVLGMARQAMVKINAEQGPALAGPFIGFIQALVENRQALNNMALEQALLHHPQLEGEVGIEEEAQP